MKKSSNFLRSSKDALTKSFNSAKCKISLKLASSRLKLLRNKKELQLKQMKRELAQLLESGQNQTARIRVEHVVREEKMIAAYDLIEIYCELIVAHLPIVESQKNCPFDLKEAITSVVFASPRCGDVPELIDVRKHLTAKYGKEFINAAVELRPDCGVSRLLVEKLSAKAPDGQTKLKILTAIAEEQGVKCDPKSFGESDLPPNDLLNGSNTFEKASKIYEDPPHFGADARTRPNHNQGPYASPNFLEMNSGSSMGMHSSASLPGGMSGEMQFSSSQLRLTHSMVGHTSGLRKNWNMEFKDAASAARDAADSAEHASLAARAAAELSRVSGKYPTESQRAHADITRDKEKGNYSASKKMGEHTSKDSPNVLFPNRNYMLQHNDGRTKQDEDSEKVPISFASSRSRVAIDKDLVISFQEADISGEKSSKEEDNNVEDVMNSHSDDSEHEHFNGSAENMTSENFNYFGEETTMEDPQNAHYASHPSTSNYCDHIQSSNDQNFRYEASEDLFLNADEGHPQKVNVQISSHYEASAVFDEPNSDDGDDDNSDDTKFDTGPVYDDQQSTFYFPLSEIKLPTYPSILGDSGNPRLNMNKFPENYTSAPESFEEKHSPLESPQSFAASDNSQVENFAPATFDDSNGGSSQSEDIEKPELIRTEASLSQMHPNPNGAVRSSTKVTGTNKTQLSHSSSNESIASGTKDDFPLLNSPGANKVDGNFTQSSFDYGKELNFGTLTGSLRHKHFIPSFTRSGQNDVSSVKKPEEIPPMMPQSIASQTVENSSFGINMKKDNESSSRTLNPHCDQDPDSSDEDFSQQISSNRHKSDIQKANMEVKTKSSLKG
nr:dentin sialophosphoprotein-like [Ipomoea batatas]